MGSVPVSSPGPGTQGSLHCTEMGAHHSTRLTEEDFAFLEEETSMSRAMLQVWYSNFLKDCPEGELSEKKFIQVYALLAKIFPGGHGREHFTKNLFKTFDTNNSGTIDFREFMLALNVISKRTPEDKISTAFQLFDVDGNGWIDFSEMKRVVSAVYRMLGTEGCTKEKAQDLFHRMDSNSDGKVSGEEFLQACTEDQELRNLLQATHVYLTSYNSPAALRRRN